MRVNWREMRAVLAALAANLGIAIIKFVAFLVSGSTSMLAESVHSVADTGNQVLLLVGRGRSARPASDEHPFGFGRERYFYGFIVSVMLFTVGAIFSVYEGVHKITNPEEIRSPLIPFIVLVMSAVLEGFSLRTAIREANDVRGDRNWGTFIRRTKSPELPVVLLEDTAALIGLALAFTGVGLAVLTHNGRWDGVGSLAIGLLLGTAAAILAVEMKSLLIGESASTDVQRRIVAALEEGPEIAQVIHMRTVHIAPDSILVAAKVAVPRERLRRADHGGHRHRRTPRPRRRTHRHDHLPRAGHLPPEPGRRERPGHPRRPAQPLARPARHRRPHEAREPREPRPRRHPRPRREPRPRPR